MQQRPLFVAAFVRSVEEAGRAAAANGLGEPAAARRVSANNIR